MKVLLVHNHYRTEAPSGESIVFDNESTLLANNGVNVIRYERHNDDLDIATVSRKFRVAFASTWSNDTFTRLSELIKREKPNIAHFHNTFPQITPSAYDACQRHSVPASDRGRERGGGPPQPA